MRVESEGKDRLVVLLEAQTTELEQRGSDLESNIEQMKGEVKVGYEQIQKMEKEGDALLGLKEEKIALLEGEVKTLKSAGHREVANVGFDPNEPSGSANAVVSIVERGLSVTDMYGRVVELEESLTYERGERAKLDLYMERILKEIQDKAPVFAAQKIDYQRAIDSHEKMALEMVRGEREKAMAERNLATVTKEWEKECGVAEDMKRENKLFASQIQNLLREKMGEQNENGNENENGGEVLMLTDGARAENTFNNVDELQTNNANLHSKVSERNERVSSTTELTYSSSFNAGSQFGNGIERAEAKRRQGYAAGNN